MNHCFIPRSIYVTKKIIYDKDYFKSITYFFKFCKEQSHIGNINERDTIITRKNRVAGRDVFSNRIIVVNSRYTVIFCQELILINSLIPDTSVLTSLYFGENTNRLMATETNTNPSNAAFIIDAKHTAAKTAAFKDIALKTL